MTVIDQLPALGVDAERVAQRILEDVRAGLGRLHTAGVAAGLATVVVVDDPAARAEQRRLERLASALGIATIGVRLDGEADAAERLRTLGDTGPVAVLGPVPAALRAAVRPEHDVCAVHPLNAGELAAGAPGHVVPAAAAAYALLDEWVDDQGHDAGDFYRRTRIVVVGGVNRVATAALLLGCTRQAPVASVDAAASGGDQLGWYTRHADVLITAAGIPGLIRSQHVRDGAVVIDAAGGDVVIDEVQERARLLGGVRAVTDAVLLRNVVRAAGAGS